MKTTNYIIFATFIALLIPARASANVYEDRLKEAFDNIISAVLLEDLSQMHTTYTDPETESRKVNSTSSSSPSTARTWT